MPRGASASRGRLTPTDRVRMFRGAVPVVAGSPTGSVDLSAGGLVTTVRASEASYQTGPESNGTFLSWAANNVLRIQNRVAGRNAIFVEGARTNQLLYSEDTTQFGANMWQNFGGTQTTAQASPDGTADAVRWVTPNGSGGFGEQNPRAFGANIRNVASYYLRRGAAADNESGGNIYRSVSGRIFPADGIARDPWRRLIFNTLMNVELQSAQPIIGFAVGGPAAGLRDAIAWGIQSENGTFVSSYIRTVGAAATRIADVAKIAAASVPTWMQTGAFQFTTAPECTSAEFLLHATEMTLFAWGLGVTNRVALVVDGGVAKLRVFVGGSAVLTTTALTWTSNWQDLTILLNFPAGSVTISGATTGNGVYTGTPWIMPGGDLYVGNVSTSATPYFGEFLPTITQQQFVGASFDMSGIAVNDRATEASYQTATASDGSVSFISWQAAQVAGVPRTQNRGVRNAFFLEGARTNFFQRSRDMTNNLPAAWTGGTMTQTANAALGVDATMVAAQFNGTGAQFSSRQTITPGAGAIMSIWARAVTSSQIIRNNFAYPNGTGGTGTLSTTYSRYRGRVGTLTTHTDYIHDCSISGATNIYVDAVQAEVGTFPSSVIRTTTTSVVRNADSCIIASANVPAWMRDGKFTLTIAPEFTSVDLILQNSEMTLLAFGTGTTDRIALIVDGATVKVRVVQGGATKVTTESISFATWDDLVLTFDSVNGYLVVAGATTGNNVYVGTSWSMQTGDVYLGNVSTAATPYFGEIVPTIQQVAPAILTPGWTPNDIADRLVLLSGQYYEGLDGNALSWLDEFGNARNATNGTVAAQPARLLKQAAYVNKNILDFNGSSHFYQTLSIPGGNNVFTFAWIGHADSLTGVRKIVETVTGGAGAFAVFAEGSKLSVWANGAAGQDYVAGDTTLVVGTRYLFIVEIPFSTLSTAAIASWVNNVAQTQTVITNTATNTTLISALWQIGRWVSAASQYWDGGMALLGGWTRSFTSTERNNFYAWAQANYGVA